MLIVPITIGFGFRNSLSSSNTMKILYAIQGTGNGHISRARDFIPALQSRAELDILISGTQFDVSLPQEIKYKFKGASFIFGKIGGVDYWETFKNLRPLTFANDIRKLDLKSYDFILNDFEPVSAWAGKIKKKPVIALSHQSSFLSPKTPRANFKDSFTEGLFRNYAPSNKQIGFHFEAYDDFINTPIIRKEIRALTSINKGHYTVYLPAYDDKLLVKYLSTIPEVHWEVFSKWERKGYTMGNVDIKPVSNEAFNTSMATCEGLLTGGGFEAPAEALFLKKKVLVIPMLGQYEQACNAEAIRRLGVPVLSIIDSNTISTIQNWVKHGEVVNVDFPDNLDNVVEKIFRMTESR